MDVGKVHSCVAWGTADGSVLVSNPVNAVLGSKRAKKQHWQICVCRLEYVKKRRSEAANAPDPQSNDAGAAESSEAEETVDVRNGNDEMKAPGVSRITQSYRAEKLDFVRGRIEKPPYATIYEEGNAVTAVRWNPNLSCGGWLAVGWGCGLVRVQNLAI